MTIRNFNQPTSSGLFRSDVAQWPHVGECAAGDVLGMVEQRDGSRVSAAGDAR